MIVPMRRAFVACQQRDRDLLLKRLHELGVLHIVPVVEREADGNGDDRGSRLAQLDTAIQVLRNFEPRGPEPRLEPQQAVRDVLAIWNGGEAARARLDALYREVEQLRPWGATRLAELRAIGEAGVDLQVLIVPDAALSQLRATVVQPLERVAQQRQLVAAIGLDPASLPRSAELLPLPARFRDEVQAEAAQLESGLELDRRRLRQLAWLLPALETEHQRLEREREWTRAVRSGLTVDVVYAVQGWLPAEREAALHEGLANAGIQVAVRTAEPSPDDRPPTLIRYRPWAKPIDGLFRILGMVPGYRELDLSSVFIVAVPLFAGMIIGDAGYGMLFALAPLLAHRTFTRLLGPDLRTLLILFGVASIAWGALTGVWFGLTPAGLVAEGGRLAAVGHALALVQLVRGSDDETRMLLIRICFLIGAGHLILAHVRQVVALAPDPRALAEVGWCAVLAAMLGVTWILFFGQGPAGPWLGRAAVAGLVLGLALVTLFTHPDRPLGPRLGLGFAGSLLPTLTAFSDTLSYIRLMAVGLASFYLGSTFNQLAGAAAESSWIAGALVLVAGHSLNLGLAMIAVFAHGVRLNVLEFSSNAGIQWAGYSYEPFSDRRVKERP